jgi:hypothetical protein
MQNWARRVIRKAAWAKARAPWGIQLVQEKAGRRHAQNPVENFAGK